MMEETFFDRYDKRLQELMRANEDIEDLKKQNKRLGRKIERLEKNSAEPDHPTALTTLEDYQNAPAATIVAKDGSWTWHKSPQGDWVSWGTTHKYTNREFADTTRRVLRWGWIQ